MIHITEVTTKAQLRQFVNFPIDLYRDVPQYIPGTYSDDLADWDREKNPAFSYCEARCWLASRDDGTLVGRIGAILSRKSNDKWGTHRLRFTQVDFIDDREVSAALFQTVEDWARQLGCTEIHGPLGFTDMDREGMLVEGFDRTSCFFTYYNHPYYIDHLTALGYVKDVDWTENLISVPTDQRVIQRWEKIAAYVLKRQRLHIHQVRSRLEYPPLIRKVFELVNVAYAPLYGTVELSDDQIRKYAGKFAPLVKPELTCFVMDENDDLVAFGVAAPQHRRRPEKARRPPVPHRLGGCAEGLPPQRHHRSAADRRASRPPEKGRQRRHHQQGHARLLQDRREAGGDRPHAGDQREGPDPVAGLPTGAA